MGVYNTCVKSLAEDTEYDFTPDPSFGGLLETVISIEEMDQRMFDTLLELDMMEMYVNEGGEEAGDASEDNSSTETGEAKPKKEHFVKTKAKVGKIVEFVKKVLAKAKEAISKAIGNIVFKIKNINNGPALKLVDKIKANSGKLTGCKVQITKTELYDKNVSGKSEMGKLGGIVQKQLDEIKNGNLENLTNSITVPEKQKAEKQEIEVTIREVQKAADWLGDSKNSNMVSDIHKAGKEAMAFIDQIGKTFEADVRSAQNSENAEAKVAAMQKVITNAASAKLKMVKYYIDASSDALKNARKVIYAAYNHITNADKTAKKEAKKADKGGEEITEESTDLLLEESVEFEALREYFIMESSDEFVDSVLLA